MTVPLWPATLLPDLPYAWKPTLRVKKGGPFGGDRWLTRADNRFPLLSAVLNFFVDDWEDFRPNFDFWTSVGGANGVFDFADFNAWDVGGLIWASVFSGQILAATLDYDLPIATSTGTGFVFKLDGVTKTVQRLTGAVTHPTGTEDGTSDVYLYPGLGTNGRDLAHTRVQQTVGAIITITGKGQRIQPTRILEEDLPVSWTENTNYTIGPLTFLEVR